MPVGWALVLQCGASWQVVQHPGRDVNDPDYEKSTSHGNMLRMKIDIGELGGRSPDSMAAAECASDESGADRILRTTSR
jgi:hypothetical protein